ncbi:MAG: acyl-CoA desaturase [Phycisphaerales bacterium]
MHHEVESREPASLAMRVTVLVVMIMPLIGLGFAIWSTWGWGFSWLYLTLLVTMYLATGLGITIGYHRLFTHKSFETSRVVTFILGVLGSMAIEGPLIRWAAAHRKHHQHSDSALDPHSPNHFREAAKQDHAHAEHHDHDGAGAGAGAKAGIKAVLVGFWHAHIGWMFDEFPKDLDRYVPDLKRDRMLRVITALFPLWVLLGLIIPTVIGGVVSGTWFGALLGLAWGGLARVFLVHHVTWSVNSVCHIWGTRAYKTSDLSRNNPIFGVLALGEGWHNNHHAFPTSARHGLEWWQFDLSWIVIRGMEVLGLARRVRVPSMERREGVRLR